MSFSLKSMWLNECPRCRQAKIFTEPFKITDPLSMPEKCKACDLLLLPEPGFYYGAMFISYILSAWLFLLPSLLLVFYFKWEVSSAMLFTAAIGILTYFKFLRGCRSLWLHMNVKYVPEIVKRVK